VWDAIETLRPAIDAKVFAFVEAHEFARRDFPQSGYNVHRLSRDVTQILLHKASLPSREIEAAAECATVRFAGVAETKVDATGRKRGRPTRASDGQSGSSNLPHPRSKTAFRN
jgi:hypothetical protein